MVHKCLTGLAEFLSVFVDLLIRDSVREAWLQFALKASLSFILHTWKYKNKQNIERLGPASYQVIFTARSYQELPVIMHTIYLVIKQSCWCIQITV